MRTAKVVVILSESFHRGDRHMGQNDGKAGTVILFDASNLIYRAYYAMKSMGRNFTAPDGTPTGGLSTYIRIIESISKIYPESPRLAIYEHPGGSFRDVEFPSYKAHRPATPDDLRSQISLSQTLLPLIGIPTCNAEGFEADDLLCAYAVKASSMGWRVIIVSSDKDMAQIVGDGVFLIDPADKERKPQGPAEIEERFGVPPSKVVEFLALMGDSVDGFGGVEGIGKKTAAKLLNAHGSIDGILAAADSGLLRPAIAEALAKARDILPMAVRLATARIDAPLPIPIGDVASHTPDWESALPELRRLAFKNLVATAERHVGTIHGASHPSPPR